GRNAGRPQGPAVANEVTSVVQRSLHDPEYLEVQEPPRAMVPQDVPRPQVAVLQQRRYGAGSSECSLETLQHVRGEADSAELPEGIRGSDAQRGGRGGSQEAGQQLRGSPGDHARDREDLRHRLYPGELRQPRQGALVGPTGNELVELQLNLAVSRTAGPGHDRAQL